jgi:hypothetical protein
LCWSLSFASGSKTNQEFAIDLAAEALTLLAFRIPDVFIAAFYLIQFIPFASENTTSEKYSNFKYIPTP